ncbi:MAG TPA: CRTAC1 family protein [Bryobacteraceae bacterium]|nr:CRTAC1 family protein [Bryobacteraceae bacterium]
MNRRRFLAGLAAAPALLRGDGKLLAFRFTDVTAPAGVRFQHNSGAFGKKYLPETMGSGCAFLDYDNDGWQDILLVNGADWPEQRRQRTTMRLYRNNRNGTFTDVTRAAGLDVELYGMGVAAGDFNNDGFVDLYISCVGQSRLFQNTGKGYFIDVTDKAGLGGRTGFSSAALWFDLDRDGLLDLLVCNYVKWAPDIDVFCTADGRQKAYCTPEAYRGATCWLFRNKGDGTFEDITAKSGIFDSSSKSLGAAMFDYDSDGWTDLFIANDTEPNKLYCNLRNGTFEDAAVRAGVAFSEDGRARGGMGVDAADVDNSGVSALVVTNFDNEMLGLYRAQKKGMYVDEAPRSALGRLSRRSLGFGCFFFDADLDGLLDLLVVNGHIDDTYSIRHAAQYAQSPHLFLNQGAAGFVDVASKVGGGFSEPKVGRGAAFADFDRDGDVDVLITTNHGPAYLYRNDQLAGNRSVRFKLLGTKSNRDAIGATVKIFCGGEGSLRMVKSGSSYLSQSELPLTFGLGRRDTVERAILTWPSGRVEEFKNLRAGRTYECIEGSGIKDLERF